MKSLLNHRRFQGLSNEEIQRRIEEKAASLRTTDPERIAIVENLISSLREEQRQRGILNPITSRKTAQ